MAENGQEPEAINGDFASKLDTKGVHATVDRALIVATVVSNACPRLDWPCMHPFQCTPLHAYAHAGSICDDCFLCSLLYTCFLVTSKPNQPLAAMVYNDWT